jgi:nucleoside-diphosphate-sugar epimerase
MIVGDGDLASIIPDRIDRLYFASGVSNSQEVRESQYKKEVDLLLSQDKDRKLVYFSTLAIFYANTRYTQHKLFMEKIIKKYFNNYCIFRIGNITWGDNPNTIINFFRNKIKNNEPIEIKDDYRYILSKKEFLHWLNLIPNFNCEINIPGEMIKVSEIVERIKNNKL